MLIELSYDNGTVIVLADGEALGSFDVSDRSDFDSLESILARLGHKVQSMIAHEDDEDDFEVVALDDETCDNCGELFEDCDCTDEDDDDGHCFGCGCRVDD